MVTAALTDVRSLAEAFQQTAATHPDAVALRTPGGAVEITWREYADRVRRIAAGLAALGVARGDTVGLMLTNRPECDLVDTAAIHLGAIPFSIYNTSSPEQISYLFSNAENQVVVTESAFLPRVQGATGTSVRHVISVDGEAEGVRSLADLESTQHPGFDFDAAWRAVRPDDVATLIYTSGTTGPPKGVELSHANVLAEVAGVLDNIPLDHTDSTVSFLPTAHIADRVTGHYLNITTGLRVTSVPDPKAVASALPDARPSVFFGVPRVWQKVKGGIEAKLATEPDRKRKIAYWAIGVGRQAALRDLAGRPRGPVLNLTHRIAERLVLAKLRHALGMDRMRWPASGAASIPVDTLEFFFGIGVPIYEVWGMSETTGAATANAPGKTRLGTVGKPALGVECALAEDGELLCRGEIVMRGYRKDPDRTSEAVDDDGWVHTGDIATIDDDGYVTIIDRKKELIISEGGKNMSPSNIENAIKSASPLVGQVVAIGDSRPYVTALIVLDPDAAVSYAEKLELAAEVSPAVLADHPAFRETIADAVRSGNQTLSRTEQIKRFQILSHIWDPGGDELTPTLKLKRRPIAEKYATEIEQLYEPSPGPSVVNLA